MSKIVTVPLANPASTGNNTHTPITVGDSWDSICFDFFVEAVGATPTVTWKIQGSNTGASGTATDWTDLFYLPGGGGATGATAASDTPSVAGMVVTGVGHAFIFPQNPHIRRFKYYRLVTSANTNVTYSAQAFAHDFQS